MGPSSTRRRLLRLSAALAAGLALGPRPAFGQAAPPIFDADVGLDPGHSPADPGASGAGVAEYEHTLDVAFRVAPLLEATGVRVNLTRTEHRPVDPAAFKQPPWENWRLEQAARIRAVGKVRIYVSIHFNGDVSGTLRGTETYYNGENDAATESIRLANALQRNVVAALHEFGYPTADRGIKDDLSIGKPYGHLFSLRGGMPSALVETLFLSNPTESTLLLRDDTRQAIAQGYAAGIVEYLKQPSA